MTLLDLAARDALFAALRALRAAEQRCIEADYGSLVLASLDQSRKELEYALAVIEGRA